MLRLPARLFVIAGLAAALSIGGNAAAAEPALAGRWKWTLIERGTEIAPAIIEIAARDGKTGITFVAHPLFADAPTLKDVRVEDRAVHFTMDFPLGQIRVDFAAARDDARPTWLRGSVQVGPQVIPALLERTEAKELTPADAQKPGPAGAALQKAKKADKPGAALLEVIEKFPASGAAYVAADLLMRDAVKDNAPEADLRAAVERFLKIAALFGTPVEKSAWVAAIQTLAHAEKVSPVAVDYARQAIKALTADDPVARSVVIHKALELALRKTGKTEEAREVAAKLVKLEEQLDVEFEKTAVPFKTAPFKGRKGQSTRVAVVELFTGAQCPPCVSADVAFDAAVKTYQPADVVLLQYHLHIPGPDALTNADTEKRAEYYGDKIEGTPTVFINGKETTPLGGFKAQGEARFGTLRKEIEKALEADAQATLTLSLDRKGDKLVAKATVADIKKIGAKARLRFVLIEDVARYAGGNGQRLHHHVVRAFPGGVAGFAVDKEHPEQTVTVMLGDLRKSLNDYLDAQGKTTFPESNRPLELKNLKVVALLQDDESKEILQAAQGDVPLK